MPFNNDYADRPLWGLVRLEPLGWRKSPYSEPLHELSGQT